MSDAGVYSAVRGTHRPESGGSGRHHRQQEEEADGVEGRQVQLLHPGPAPCTLLLHRGCRDAAVTAVDILVCDV